MGYTLQREKFNEMERLSPLEVAIAGYYTYAGIDNSTYDKRGQIASALGKTPKDANDAFNNLVSLGFIKNAEYGYWYKSTKVVEEFIFQIIFYIYEKYPNYVDIFSRLCSSPKSSNVFFWRLAKAVQDDDARTVQKLIVSPAWPSFTDLYPYISRHIFEKEFFPIISTMPQNQVADAVNRTLDVNLSYAPSREFFDLLDELVDYYVNYNLIDTDYLHDMIASYRFMFLADEPKWSKSLNGTLWKYATEAIIALYKGNLTLAGDFFSTALKIHNRQSNDKNLFYSPVLSFYLMLYYAKDASAESRKKVEAFLKKPYLQKTHALFPAQAIAQYVALNEPSEGANFRIPVYLSEFHGEPLTFFFANLISKYLGFTAKECRVADDDFKFIPPCALLRYELSPYLPCADAEDLASRLGGRPILQSLQRKQQWEKVMDDILFSLAGDPKTKAVGSSRIIYLVGQWGRSVEPKEQKWLKSGRWGMPSNVSFSSFVGQEKDCMDDVDKQIALITAKNYEYEFDEILPILVGSDKVYYRDGDSLYHVTIEEDKVYLNIEESSNGFKVSTNLPSSQNLKSVVISKISDTHYKVFKLTASELNIIKAISAIDVFPKEAEQALKDLISKLDGRIEVHSSLIEGGSTLEKKEGSSIVTLSLRPNAEQYHLSIFVRPLDGGTLKVSPGRGKAVVYDTVDDTRYQISRDLSSEKVRYNDLVLFLEDQISAEPSETPGNYILGPMDMLELLDYVKDRTEDYCVEWPKGQSVKIKSRVSSSSVRASIANKEHWFEMEGDVKIDDETVMSLQKLLELYGQGDKGRFIKLSDGDFIALSESLRKQLRALEDLSTVGAGRVPVYQVGALAELVHGKESILSAGKDFQELEQKIEAASKLNPKVPASFQGELRDYQMEGFKWISRLAEWGAGACLADDMGLGKTLQAAAFMLSRASKGPSLIVAPASVVLNWASELARFTPTLNISILNEAASRKDVIEDAKENDVVLCSYALMAREEETLTAKKWNVICLDEAHTIKNRSTKMSMAAMKLSAQARLILTGTPVQNHLNELWNLFQFINPGLLGTLEKFQQRYITGENADENAKRLRKVIQPFILRRRKIDVIDELPDKTEIQRNIVMTDLETASYESMRSRVEDSLEEISKVDVKVLAEITRLRQASCSMSLVDSKWNNGSSKIDAAVDLINQIVDGGNRVLVFSQFTSFLKMVKDALSMENVLYLDGSTPIRKRSEMVEAFQNGEANVFFISLKAGGLGLNLTGANYVIHLDPWWNPAIEQQATDRAYRIGQEQNVTVYHLISAHTIEEKILRLHKTKKDMADALLEGTDMAKAISLDELRNLVSI